MSDEEDHQLVHRPGPPYPRPEEPLLKDPWELTLSQWTFLTRATACIVLMLFSAILVCCSHVYYLDTEKCELFVHTNAVRAEEVKFKPGLTFQDRQFVYRLLEYKLYDAKQVREEDENAETRKDEIIVIFITAEEAGPMEGQHLGKMVRDLSQDQKFRFVWYTLDFDQEMTIANGYHFATQFLYLSRVMEFLSRKHRRSRFVLIGNSYGGTIAHSLLSMAAMDKVRNSTDLIIFQGAQITHPSYYADATAKNYFFHIDKLWKESTHESIGLVSFSGGPKTSDTHWQYNKVRRAVNIPAWSIDGVPDAGIICGKMPSCKPFMSHVAELMIEYGKHHKEETGNEIVKKFYADYNYKKITKLPEDWSNDWVTDPIVVRTGGSYEFDVNQTQWLEVKLERGEFIEMKIMGYCLKSATIIADRKHIRRKEQLIDDTYFKIGVFDANHLEDVRVLIESDTTCSVVIETSSSWLKYGTRFYLAMLRDTHQIFLGLLLTHMYLLLLEGDSRVIRFKKQCEFYAFLLVATVFHSVHSIGLPSAGVLFGALVFTTMFMMMSGFQQILLLWWRRTLDAPLLYDISLIQYVATLGCFITLFAHNYGFMTMVIAFILRNRTFLAVLGIASVGTLIVKMFFSTVNFTFNYLMGAPIYSIATIGGHWTMQFIKFKLSRKALYIIGCSILTWQMCRTQSSLDVHYAFDLVLLVFIANSVNYTPPEYYKRHVDPHVLESQEVDAEIDQANEPNCIIQ